MKAPTIFEEGKETGQRELLTLQLEARFGPISEDIRRRLDEIPAAGLIELGRKLLKAQSLAELGLDS